ncbi:MAG: SRPBCC family protein [Thermoanaerobaculia bacterium]
MSLFEFRSRTRVPRPLPEVFAFFADAANLQELTPPWLRFEILTPRPIEMRPGALIDYRIHLRFIPMKWCTRITVWEPPHRFVDEQLKGPYRMWLHEHTFEEEGDGTLVGDYVRYSVPFGALANWLFVRRDVERIFAYREKRLGEIFGGSQ